MSHPFDKAEVHVLDAGWLFEIRNLIVVLILVVGVITVTTCVLAYEGFWIGMISGVPSAAGAAFSVGVAFGKKIEHANTQIEGES